MSALVAGTKITSVSSVSMAGLLAASTSNPNITAFAGDLAVGGVVLFILYKFLQYHERQMIEKATELKEQTSIVKSMSTEMALFVEGQRAVNDNLKDIKLGIDCLNKNTDKIKEKLKDL